MPTEYKYPEAKAIVSWWKESVRCSIVLTNHGHYCGYARFPVHPVTESGYHGILTYVPVHGGITYARADKDGTMVYGFDCAHADDDNNPNIRDIEWLKAECRRMVGAILAAAAIEVDYLTAPDNARKATVINSYHEVCKEHGCVFGLPNNLGALINVMAGEL